MGSMSEDDEGRAVVNCTTLLPLLCSPPPMLLPINEEEEEALTGAVDTELPHRRLGHMEKTAMARLLKEDLVRGMEGGADGELRMCRGCELGKPLAKPHPLKSVLYRATRKFKLVHADLARPMRQQSWRKGYSLAQGNGVGKST